MNLRKDHYRVLASTPRGSNANELERTFEDRCNRDDADCGPEQFAGRSSRTACYLVLVCGVPISICLRSRGASGVCLRRPSRDGSKNAKLVFGFRRPACLMFSCYLNYRRFTVDSSRLATSVVVSLRDERDKTLSGGSLGSCVDEERSQLREVM